MSYTVLLFRDLAANSSKMVGLHDLNSARCIITERFVLDCDKIFAVCNIGRAVTDAGVKSVLDLAKRANKLSSVGIVCTKSDVSQIQASRYFTLHI